MSELCTRCGVALTNDNWGASRRSRGTHMCKACDVAKVLKWKKENPTKYKEGVARSRAKRGGLSMSENKTCSMYLGVHIAEHVLSKVFKNVTRMPNGNQGYDFICNKGMKIDVKSSTLRISKIRAPLWFFNINRNKVADYFLCLAFDNRESLTPLHLWLVPAKAVSHMHLATISTTTVDRWNKYKLDINKVISCCDTLQDRVKTQI